MNYTASTNNLMNNINNEKRIPLRKKRESGADTDDGTSTIITLILVCKLAKITVQKMAVLVSGALPNIIYDLYQYINIYIYAKSSTFVA